MQVPEGLEKTVLEGTPGSKRTSEVLSPPASLCEKKKQNGHQ